MISRAGSLTRLPQIKDEDGKTPYDLLDKW